MVSNYSSLATFAIIYIAEAHPTDAGHFINFYVKMNTHK